MEYSLLAIFYFIQNLFNLFLQMEITEGVTVAGLLFAVMTLSAFVVGVGISGALPKANKKE